MKQFLLKMLIRFMDKDLSLKFRDDGDEISWLKELDGRSGFKSYVVVRSWTIMKEMGNGLSEREYWVAMGQRKELLLLAARAKEYRGLGKNMEDNAAEEKMSTKEKDEPVIEYK